jgi:hypothetical protein
MEIRTPEQQAAYITALETELSYAQQVKPGGQPVNEARVAAIAEELQRARGAETADASDTPAPESDVEAEVETADASDDLETAAPKATRKK